MLPLAISAFVLMSAPRREGWRTAVGRYHFTIDDSSACTVALFGTGLFTLGLSIYVFLCVQYLTLLFCPVCQTLCRAPSIKYALLVDPTRSIGDVALIDARNSGGITPNGYVGER